MPQAGDTAPDFALTNDAEETVRLSDFGRRVILYFYPKARTAG